MRSTFHGKMMFFNLEYKSLCCLKLCQAINKYHSLFILAKLNSNIPKVVEWGILSLLWDIYVMLPTLFIAGFFQRPLIKRKQDVAAGSYKNNESILPKTGIFTHRDELKMAAGAGKSLLCSLCAVFVCCAGISLRRVIMKNMCCVGEHK